MQADLENVRNFADFAQTIPSLLVRFLVTGVPEWDASTCFRDPVDLL
jgi:hypothetical protein